MTVKCKRRTRLAGRPQASFGSLFTTVLAPAINAGASVLDGALAKHKANVATSANNNANDVTNSSTSDNTDSNTNNVPQVDTQGIKELNVPNPVEKPLEFNQETVQSDPTKARLGTRVGQRHKCWIGAAIGGLTSIAGSLFNSAAQKKQMRAQQRMQDYNTALQDAQGIAQSLNGSIDAQEAYLKQFRNAARFGKNLKGNITITDGGDAQPISNNTFLLRGGSHEDINETGQTGIGINVGGNQIEAEGGEVAQEKNGTLRIFSAQPILGNGMSPAQAILRGYNKDKVFAAQERFKRNNHLNDDGSKAKYGNVLLSRVPDREKLRTVINDEEKRRISRFNKASKLRANTRYGIYDVTRNQVNDELIPIKDYLYDKARINFYKLKGNIKRLNTTKRLKQIADNIHQFVSPSYSKFRQVGYNSLDEYDNINDYNLMNDIQKYDNFVSDDRDIYDYGDLPFRLGGKVRKLRLGGRTRFAKGSKVRYNKPDYYHWIHQTSNNLKVSPIDSTYDYRAYYDSATPWELANTMYNAKNGHFTDVGKRPSHPTFSNESKYSNSKTPGGTWNGDVFVPAIWQFGNNGNKIRNRYMNNTGEGYFDGRRNVYPKYRIGGRIKAKDGTSISLNYSYSNKDLLSRITEGHPTARKIVDEIFGSAGDRRKFINDLNFLGLASDDASSIAGASPIFRQPIVGAAKQARYVQEANKARQTANANKARQTASYTEKQANQTEPFIDYLGKELKNVGNKLGINIDYRPTTYTPTNLGFAIDQAARNMTKGANPFLYTNSSTINKTAKNILNGSKKVYTNVKGKLVNPNTYRYSEDARRVRDASGRLIWQPNYKLRPWVKGAAVATGAGLLTGIGAGLSNLETEDEKTQRELNDYGKPISPYIARPNTKQTSNRTKKDSVTQIPDSIRKPIAKKYSVITPVFKQALNKDSVRRDSVKPRYKGNVTKGNYQLHDGESKVINGVKYTRVGNNIINHKTNVAYIYDKNGNYTGQADYSKVGKNFNDAFDAARAAGRKDFIYRAGKYNNYSTAKETDAKREALNRRIGLKRIAKRYGGNMPPRKRYDDGGTAYSGALSEVDVTGSNRRKFNDWNNYMLNYGLGFNTKPNIAYQTLPQTPQVKTEDEDNILNTPYLGKSPSFNPALQDYIGLGIDTLAAVGSGIINYKSAGKYTLPERAGYISPSKLVTSYNITPQLQEIKRMRDKLSSSAYNNTSSSVAALNRVNNYNINSLTELGKAYAEKENEETKLLNQDALNQQSVAEKNIANDIAYNTERARILNEYNQRRGNALSVSLSGLAQAYSNFANSAENRYNTRQNTIAMAAGNRDPKVATMALQMGYDFNPEVLAGIYKSTDDKNLQRLVLGKLSTKDRIKYGII